MDARTLVAQYGGTCTWRHLRAALSKRAIARALASGEVSRVAKGRYVLPSIAESRSTAVRLHATASHTTAALHWGWAVKAEPQLPHLTLPRGRKLRAGAREGVTRHWRTLDPDDVIDGWVTSPMRTVIDCCLDLPFDEALAVVDSAWRDGLSPLDVFGRARLLPTRCRRKVAAVLRHADRRAANPFESVLRALCISVTGLEVEAQVEIKDPSHYAKVDLADAALRLVIEAESFEHHGDRPALKRDCRRYTSLGARGWCVLRFTWDEVMFDQDYVLAALRLAVATRRPTATNSTPAVA